MFSWEQPLCALPDDINPSLKPFTYTELQLDLILPDLGMQPGPEPLEPTDPEPPEPTDPEPPEPTDLEPQPNPTMPNKSQCVAEEEHDIFDNEEEYVGVDDEHMYITIPPAQPSLNA